ncbi:MAG TPA: recombinase family protein, partial [bacterium]|nr:recombinase family protein [bacterium]
MIQNYFLYVRKSTDTEERQVLSIESQIAELKLFAERENLKIKNIFQEAMTAKVPGRPIFSTMLSKIEKGEADGIIAWHPDRLARNSVDGGRIIYLLDTEHIKFLKFPTFWFENTPQGKFMMQIAFGQSKYYIDNLSENVRRGLRQKVRRGEWPAGRTPPGYFLDKNDRKVKIHPIQGPFIRRLFETYALGNCTLQDLKEMSFEWGLKSLSGTPWAKSQLQKTLKNTFYFGLMNYKDECHQGIHEPLISKELFDRVQKTMVHMGRPNKYRKRYFPLLGLATCPKCGCSITATLKKGHNYYHCTKRRGPCPERYLREEHYALQISLAI